MAAYGLDVLDPAVTARRIHVLTEQLPPYGRAPGEEWSAEAYLIASVIDAVAQLTYVTLKAAGAKSARKPKPVPRPGQQDRRGAAAPAAGGRLVPGGGPVKTRSWAEAADLLMGLPGAADG